MHVVLLSAHAPTIELLRKELSHRGHTLEVPDPDAPRLARDLFRRDLLVLDAALPDAQPLLAALRELGSRRAPQVVLLTDRPCPPLTREELSSLDDLWVRPLDPVELGHRVALLCRRRPAEPSALDRVEPVFRALAHLIPHGAAFLFDRELRFRCVDGPALADFGFWPESMEGKRLEEVMHQEAAALLRPIYEDALAGREGLLDLPAGPTTFLVLSAPVRDPDGQVAGGMVFTQEARSPGGALAALRKSVLDHLPDAILFVNSRGTILEANARVSDLFGQAPEELVGRSVEALLPARLRELHTAYRAQYEAHPRDRAMGSGLDLTALTRDGQEVPVDVALSRTTLAGATVTVAAIRDATERRFVEDLRRRSEAAMTALFDAVPECVRILDPLGRVARINAAGLALLGGADGTKIVGQPALPFVAPDHRARFLRHLQRVLDGQRETFEFEVLTARGERRTVESHATPFREYFEDGRTAYLAVSRDVTEARALRARVVLSDRMASVGVVAAGVAHEVNTPLAVVTGNVSLALEELVETRRSLRTGGEAEGPGPVDLTRLHAHLENATQALWDARLGADRVRSIVRDLKMLSRGDEDRRGAVDLNAALASSITMAWNEIRHRARLVKDLGRVPPVLGSEARLGQVIVNLLVNAAHAIPEGNPEGNVIRVATRAPSPEEVVLEVTDTGSGISAENLPRVFDAFFTTKEQGAGTGLGLSITHGIVTGLGGSISVESEVGRGTTFRVRLPAAREGDEEVARHPTPAEAPAQRARILAIDDDEMIGTLIRRCVGRQHDVLVLTTCREALDRLHAGERFDLILCDLMLPEMSGMQFYEELGRRFPGTQEQVIFLTGGAFTPRARAFLDATPNQRLEKPFDPQQLVALVRERMRRSSS
ncbi:MAG: PAS domain-containing protein [Deltaproteobacteria bacterium]|nr:PAS domain-containing protein [Deltaproteobacteria bacterium]